jgi:hypothetical protein
MALAYGLWLIAYSKNHRASVASEPYAISKNVIVSPLDVGEVGLTFQVVHTGAGTRKQQIQRVVDKEEMLWRSFVSLLSLIPLTHY